MTRAKAEDGIYLKRTIDGFAFASAFDQELGERWAIGSIVRADIHKPRSGKHNRWYRALVRTVWKHQEQFPSPDALHKFLQYRLGEYDSIHLKDGGVLIDFHSTAYDSMDEGRFTDHVMQSWEVIRNEIIPGLDTNGRIELLGEIDKLLRGSSQ